MRRLLGVLGLTLLLLAAAQAQPPDTLRERLKARIEQRRADTSCPAPIAKPRATAGAAPQALDANDVIWRFFEQASGPP